MDVNRERGFFGDDYYTAKFEFSKKGSGGEDAERFRNSAEQFGMKPEWLGGVVMLQLGAGKHPITKEAIPAGLYPAKIVGMTARGKILVSFLDGLYGDSTFRCNHEGVIKAHELASNKERGKAA